MSGTKAMREPELVGYLPASPLIIIVGNYGSGKTEVAVNLAAWLRGTGKAVQIADLDIVNPYFRCREARDHLEALGVRVVIPPGAHRFADLPIVVPEIKAMQHPAAGCVSIFDVGGDDAGATILSSLREALGDSPYSLLQVINCRRPFTDTVDGCLKMRAAIEAASRLRVSGFVANTHLIEETRVETILDGYEIAAELSRQSGVPIVFVTAMGALADAPELAELPVPVFRLVRNMLPPWLCLDESPGVCRGDGRVPAALSKPIFRP